MLAATLEYATRCKLELLAARVGEREGLSVGLRCDVKKLLEEEVTAATVASGAAAQKLEKLLEEEVTAATVASGAAAQKLVFTLRSSGETD